MSLPPLRPGRVVADPGRQGAPEAIVRLISTLLRCVLVGAVLATPIRTTPAWAQQQPRVVFVCEHGNVKSLIAATLFDQAARKRGLSISSTSRGINPEPDVPGKIVDELRKDGVDVSRFKPQALTQSDVSAAQRVIAIGVDLDQFETGKSATVENWADIPAASVDYAAARAALLRHIDALLSELQAHGSQEEAP